MVIMFQRRLDLPRTSFFLMGPRGTGKSTWIRAALGSASFVDLLDEARFQSYLADPSRSGAEVRTLARGSWVVVDEIQRLPSLLNEVHRAMQESKLKFALTGSSARKLRQGGTNLLGGRARELTMYPFVPEELGKQFRLERALEQGTLPLVWDSEEPEHTLRAYVEMYLKQEIQAEALVRNLPGFARFLPVAALMHGQTMNLASLARDAGVARQTITGYIHILHDTLVATTLGAFEAKLRVRERSHPKLYWFDAGIVRALKHQRGTVSPEERGALLEGFVFMLLRFYRDRAELFSNIGYWAPREAATTEVDFVLARGKEHLAIEVKATGQLRPSDLRGLRAIAELPGLVRRLLVFLGPRTLKTPDGVDVWPLTEFAKRLQLGTLWP